MFRLSKSKNLDFAALHDKAADLISEIPAIKRRRMIRRGFIALKYFSIGVISLFIIVSAIFAAQAMNLKNVYSSAITGKNNLEDALLSARSEKFSEAAVSSGMAVKNFAESQTSLIKVRDSFFISHIPFLKSQFDDTVYLMATAKVLSEGVGKSASLGNELSGLLSGDKKFSFSKFTREEKEKILEKIYNSGPELSDIKNTLDQAALSLDHIHISGILWPFRGKINDLKEKVGLGRELLAQSIPMSKILPSLSGYPRKTAYLFLLQNNSELRPTGGFIGTYGILEMEFGDILRFDTHDIYHMDMPVKDKFKIDPPEPIKKYLVPSWYMRDSNWSPDWPTSAEKALWFYKNEDKLLPPKDQINNFKGEFNGVIAITPELVTDLMAITGPIVINGQEYNKDNFTDILEYRVEKGYVQLGVPSWQRKEVIGDIVKELKIRLFDLPSSRWTEIIDVISGNILKKNILVYDKNSELENMLKEQNWTGEMKAADGDYLMVADANMGALKTDAVMKRSIEYKINQGGGGMIAKLKVNYAHNGGSDWRTGTYKTYTRIYVPSGSQLIAMSAGGERLAEADVQTGSELGKTYFGVYITVNPGKINSLEAEYKLPARLNYAGGYSLFAQKQPGKDVDEFMIDVKLADEVRSYSPVGFFASKSGDREVKWETDLNVDRKFEIKF